jgi:hypothetical protein
MAREKESYRDNLARLDTAFPDKEILKFPEVVTFLGLDRRIVEKRFGSRFQKIGRNVRIICKTDLAREMCK